MNEHHAAAQNTKSPYPDGPRILIDNYDSFTYNLVQYFAELSCPVDVIRNDQITVEALFEQKPQSIIISPGPSDPDHAGICMDVIRRAAEETISLFGVCLGHQAIGQVFGGKIVRAPAPMHGKTSAMYHKNTDLFKGLPNPFEATRYHSLIIEADSFPHEDLEIMAKTQDGIIMGLAHKAKPIYGVQFHPESIATEHGHALLKNFLMLSGAVS